MRGGLCAALGSIEQKFGDGDDSSGQGEEGVDDSNATSGGVVVE